MIATIAMFTASVHDKGAIAATVEYYTGGGSSITSESTITNDDDFAESKSGKRKKKKDESVNPKVDYYFDEEGEGTEGPGEWVGNGAAALGLQGRVTPKQLFNMLRGKSPDGKKQLTKIQKQRKEKEDGAKLAPTKSSGKSDPSEPTDQSKSEPDQPPSKRRKKQRTDHMPGFDIVFTPPKEVSMLWLLLKPMRPLILEAAMDAVKDSMKLLEAELPLIRRGLHGENREFGNLVYSIFTHFTARNENDPNLHFHVVCPNMIVDKDGKVQKIDSRILMPFIRTLGPLFRNSLFSKLQKELGVRAFRPIEEDKYQKNDKYQKKDKYLGWFGIEGVCQKLKKHWSSRRTELLEATEMSGASASDPRARQAANLRTRKTKTHELTLNQLEDKWLKDAAAFGVTPETIASALGKKPQPVTKERLIEAFKNTTEQLTNSEATFTRHDFIRVFSEQLQDVAIEGKNVVKVADVMLKRSQELVVVQDQGQQKIFTTKEMWQLEKEVIAMIDKLSKKEQPLIKQEQLDTVLKNNPHLADEQVEACSKTLTKAGSLACITGHAGSGKSTTLKPIVEGLKLQGKNVICISMGGAAVLELQEKTGMECATAAKFLLHTEKSASTKAIEAGKHHANMYARAAAGKSTWTKRQSPIPPMGKDSAVIIDEAAMFDTRTMHRVLTQVDKAGAQVIAVGDVSQLTPIGAGCLMKQMVKAVGTSELKTNYRQTAIEAQASLLVREGDAEAALAIYREKGDLHVAKNRTEAANKLVSDWAKDGGLKRPEAFVIIVQTNSEVSQMNRKCQNARLLAGTVSPIHVQVGEDKIHINDRVMMKETVSHRGIANSNLGTVKSIDESGNVTVTLDRELSKGEKARGLKQDVVLTRKDLTPDFIGLGYSSTTHKFQGGSLERVYVLAGGPMTNRNLTYVALSRSTEQCRLYIDRDHAGHKLAAISQAASKHVEKYMAHELALEIKKT